MTTPSIPRRAFVIGACKTLGAAHVAAVVACTDDRPATTSGETSTGADTTDGTGNPGGGSSTGDASSTGEPPDVDTGSSSSTAAADDSSSSGEASTSSGDSTDGSSSGTDAGAECEPSPSDIEGPFYRPDIPIGGNLDVHGDPGVVLILQGSVVGTMCEPLAGAVVELWHATPVAPDGEPGDVDATYDASAEYRYYGQVATEADGSFQFTTKRPGWYLNGASYRPAHLHLKVWVDGAEVLTTQLYFVGDPFNDSDQWFNPVMALDPDERGVAEIQIVV